NERVVDRNGCQHSSRFVGAHVDIEALPGDVDSDAAFDRADMERQRDFRGATWRHENVSSPGATRPKDAALRIRIVVHIHDETAGMARNDIDGSRSESTTNVWHDRNRHNLSPFESRCGRWL